VRGWEPVHQALRTRPKYVASTTLADPEWAGSSVLSGDLEAAVRELKATPGGELQVHGSGTLARWLLEKGLVDEMTLIVVPVVLGQGARLFPADGPDLRLDLVESRVDSKGVTVQVFRPAGRPQYPAV
jgi:dihydrofolate reductase